MKTVLSLLVFALPAASQITFPIAVASESPVSTTMSAQGVISATNWILGTPGPLTSPTTLTSSVTSTQTTFPLASTLNVATGMGVLCGSELSQITGISGNTLTVTRGMIGTGAVTHATGSVCSFTLVGGSSEFTVYAFNLLVQTAMTQFPGPTISNANAAITTQAGIISSALAIAVTHVP